MSLTRTKTLAAIQCAAGYPAGHGYSFFADHNYRSAARAALRLAFAPKAAEHG